MRKLLAMASSLIAFSAQAQDFPPGAQLYAPLPEPGVTRNQPSGNFRVVRPARPAAVGLPAPTASLGTVVAARDEIKPPQPVRAAKPVSPDPITVCRPEERALALCPPGAF